MPNGWSQNEISGACINYSATLSNIQKYEITIAIATERGGFKIECNIGRAGFPGSSNGQESTCNAENLVRSLGQEDPLKEGIATHSSILAWRIPWTEEPGRL